jgi:hypothetical protein
MKRLMIVGLMALPGLALILMLTTSVKVKPAVPAASVPKPLEMSPPPIVEVPATMSCPAAANAPHADLRAGEESRQLALQQQEVWSDADSCRRGDQTGCARYQTELASQQRQIADDCFNNPGAVADYDAWLKNGNPHVANMR